MGRDIPDGRMFLRKGKLDLDWKTDKSSAYFERLRTTSRGIAHSLGGRFADNPIVTGDPLPGITPTEFQEFRRGLEDFREVEEASEGLGPLFNGTGCAVCHNVPAIGGSSPMTELRGGFRDASGRFHVVGGTTHMAPPALEELRRSTPAARSLPLLAALARNEPAALVVDYLSGLELFLAAEPVASRRASTGDRPNESLAGAR